MHAQDDHEMCQPIYRCMLDTGHGTHSSRLQALAASAACLALTFLTAGMELTRKADAL